MTKLLLGAGSHATAEVAKWEGLHAKAVAAYNAQLWNASAGLYSDWIDTAGATRHETTRHDTTRHAFIFFQFPDERRSFAKTRLEMNAKETETRRRFGGYIGMHKGGRRNYFYVWQQFNAIDPASGIANSSRAAAMMTTIDSYLAAMRARYNKTQDELWCTPTNLDAARGTNWSGIADWDGVTQGGVELGSQQYFGHYVSAP
jgi:hypothetical protein